jgi:ADP-ribose pyrophosphatase YjhB (NUDIX family)
VNGADTGSAAPVWRRRVTAHGLVRDRTGRVLLVPAATVASAGVSAEGAASAADAWTLPGGTIAHGESPQGAVARLTVVQTGLTPRVRAVRTATADQVTRPDGVTVHNDRLLFDLSVPMQPGGPRSLRGGAHWFTPDELANLRLPGYAAEALDRKPDDTVIEDSADAWAVVSGMARDDSGRTLRVQRFSTYARATDPSGRVLLAKIATGYPSAGRWHLPGGGTDVGEAPAEALLREVTEETGQRGTVGRLLRVSHRHNPVARGWEGYPINWHTIRVVYEMTVDEPTDPQVTEAAGGSTVEAAWMRPGEVERGALTDLAATVL